MTNTQEVPTHRIVVGIDGSVQSVAAFDWALRQAQLTGSAVEVIAAWEWPAAAGAGMVMPTDFDPESDARVVVDKLLASEHVARQAVVTASKIVSGPAGSALVDASRGADLLVIGSRGHGELVGLLLGSVSEHCVSHAFCPVVVIRD